MGTSALAAADAVRGMALKQLLRVHGVREIFVSRERRIPVAEFLCVVMSLVVSALAPVMALWTGAALFGIPHVLSGIRHLGVRRKVHLVSKVMMVAGSVLGASLFFG